MHKVPKYRGLRILIIPIILYYMLISPVHGILYVTYIPKLLQNNLIDLSEKSKEDSIVKTVIESDSIANLDSLINEVEQLTDDTTSKENHGITINFGEQKSDINLSNDESLFFNSLLIALLAAFIYSLPFKIYFRRKRKNRKIPDKISQFCRKTILYSPLIIAGIITIPFILQHVSIINGLYISNIYKEELERELHFNYWLIFILSSVLTIAFVYIWQKHNMQLKYLQHIFSPEELRKRIFKFKRGKIKYRLVFSSFLTTLLPLTIVVVYLLMSLTSVSDIGLYEPTQSEYKVIFGEYFKLFGSDDLAEIVKSGNLRYINVINTILMFSGIGSGIFVTIIYLIYFVSWMNSDIINPVNELLRNMQKTTGGQLQNYSLVRTNDELGELSENYNIMTSKLNEYVSHIDKMNAELEQKVKERTAEIQAQKEEIEAQRDEVESQRDEIERQRDYVIEQRDLIILQKKAITDSIEYAGNIQSAILPPLDYLKSILNEHFIYFKPRDIVSGDFYWAHRIKNKKNNKTVIVAADSTGHGVPGAFMSMLGVTLLNEIIVKKGILAPAKILGLLKENVVHSLHQTNEVGKPKDGIDLAICLLDYDKMEVEYAGAYNPVYIIRTLGSDNEFEEYLKELEPNSFKLEQYGEKILIEPKADRNPIGISHKTKKTYSAKKIRIKKGDLIYLFSDGFADQFGGPKRLKFLYSRFKELLANISSHEMEAQREEINKAFNVWKGHEKQVDDILVMGIKIN